MVGSWGAGHNRTSTLAIPQSRRLNINQEVSKVSIISDLNLRQNR